MSRKMRRVMGAIAIATALAGSFLTTSCDQENVAVTFYMKEVADFPGGVRGADASKPEQFDRPRLHCWASTPERLAELINDGNEGQSGDPGFSGGEYCHSDDLSLEGYEQVTIILDQ